MNRKKEGGTWFESVCVCVCVCVCTKIAKSRVDCRSTRLWPIDASQFMADIYWQNDRSTKTVSSSHNRSRVVVEDSTFRRSLLNFSWSV